MMLDWLAGRHSHDGAAAAAQAIEQAVDRAFATGLKPWRIRRPRRHRRGGKGRFLRPCGPERSCALLPTQ